VIECYPCLASFPAKLCTRKQQPAYKVGCAGARGAGKSQKTGVMLDHNYKNPLNLQNSVTTYTRITPPCEIINFSLSFGIFKKYSYFYGIMITMNKL
jgi:hypothetical protein